MTRTDSIILDANSHKQGGHIAGDEPTRAQGWLGIRHRAAVPSPVRAGTRFEAKSDSRYATLMQGFFRNVFVSTFLASLTLSACDCGGDASPGVVDEDGSVPRDADTSDGAPTGGDGSSSSDATDGADGSAVADGGNTDGSAVADGGENDGSTANDGSTGGDGGNPLEDPLSEFCSGEGTVVIVGGSGECAGSIAERTFQFALCACDTIEVQSNLDVDAFDSRLGTYGATLAMGRTNILEDGHAGINGALAMDGKLTVFGSLFVGGGGVSVGASSEISQNAYAAGDAVQTHSSTHIGRNAFIDGNVGGRYDIDGDLYVPTTATVAQSTLDHLAGRVVRGPILNMTPCPCGENDILDIVGLTAWARTHNDNAVNDVLTSTTWSDGLGPSEIVLPCGRYYLTNIAHPGGLTVRAEGRTVLFVDGDMNIAGGLVLELAPGAEIDLFIAGNLSVGAAARLGHEDRPSMVRTYVGGDGDIELKASSVFGGNLYAPRANVIFGASASLFGALFANHVTFSGSADIHFDSAVRTASRACEPPPPPTDGGVADGAIVDGGPTQGDAAIGADAGTSTSDAGTSSDAGVSSDASASNDASIPFDAGGPESCTSCGQCAAPEGCVRAPGETAGICAPCELDTDCCAPRICIAGQCTFGF